MKSIKINGPLEKTQLSGNLFLVVHNPHSMPPHIGLMHDGFYFSLKINGKDLHVPSDIILKNSSKKNKPLLFFKLKNSDNLSSTEIKSIISNCFNKYEKVSPLGPSCIFPLLDFICELYKISLDKVDFFYQLIPLLKNLEILVGVFLYGKSKVIKNHEYQLLIYDSSELKSALTVLSN
ncbi:MAG: hypothetical protein ACK5D5_11365 [Bacteroidota bacterium]|jgi:hypothetical protein